jgi:xanthine dehydrogenase accessory factor
MPRAEPIEAIVSLLAAAPPGVLATISSVRGSSPAPLLSRLLVSSAGETVGTVGGGCLEAEVVREAQRVRAAGGWARVAFTLTEAEEELRMVCGGTVEVLLERLGAEDLPLFRLLAERAASGATTLLARTFDGGAEAEAAGAGGRRIIGSSVSEPSRLLLGEEGEVLWGSGALPADVRGAALQAIHEERTHWSADGRIFLEPVVGVPRLVLFGGGHVSRAVFLIAREVGFRIAVADDRARYASPARFPDAERFVVPGFAEIARHVALGPHDSALVCTRGHQFDEEVLDQVLRMPPVRYVGVIGSRRKHRVARERLAARGVLRERLDGLFAPVGLDIGAVTPEEIAVAIVAQVVAVRRRAVADRARHLAGTPVPEGTPREGA